MDRPWITLALSLVLALLITALYVQTAGHNFTVCDDNVYIYDNPRIRGGLTQHLLQLKDHFIQGKPEKLSEMPGNAVVWAFADAHEGNWHPLTWLSHMLDWEVFGRGSWEEDNGHYKTSWAGGHHLVSMCIHCVNAVLLFLALRLMTGTLWPSFVVAVLFGIHPLRVESVAWAAERKDVLCGLFWTASMLAYAVYARRRPIRPASLLTAVGIAFLVGMLFVRLLVWPDLGLCQFAAPVVLTGMAVAGLLVFLSMTSASWLTPPLEIGSYLLITLFLALGLMAKSMIVTLPCVFILLDIWPLGRWQKALSLPGRKEMNMQVPGLHGVIGMIIMVVSVIGMGMGALRVLFVSFQIVLLQAAKVAGPLDLLVGGGVIAVSLVFFLLGYGLWAGNQRAFRTAFLLVEKVPWFAMALGDAYITVYGQNKGVALNSLEGLPMGARLLNAVVSCGEYLRQTVWPTGLAPFYAHPAMIPDGWTREFYLKFGIYAALLAAITGTAIWGFFCKRTFLAVGWFWYLGTLIPVIGIIQVGTQARADRYTYLPMIGVYLMMAWLFKEVADRWPKTRVALAAAAVVVLMAVSAVTFRQVSYWVDSYKIFEHAVQVTERNYFAYNHIGIAYDSDAKKMTSSIGAKEAKELFDHVAENFKGPPQKLDDALKPLLPDDAAEDFQAASKKLDRLQQQQLLFDFSADAFQATIDIKPDYDFGNNNLGVYYARKNKPEDLALAEKYFSRALMSNQRYADAYNNLGIILYREGKFDEAIRCHKAGLGVRDDRASDHNNLTRVYMQKGAGEIKKGEIDNAKGDLEDAMQQNAMALQCDPNFLGAWLSRAEIYILQKNLNEAVKCLPAHDRHRRQVAGNHPGAFDHGGQVHRLRRPDEAIELISRFLKINDAVPEMYNARGFAYLQKGDWNRAREDFEQVVRLAPRFPGVQEKLEYIRAQLANPPRYLRPLALGPANQ